MFMFRERFLTFRFGESERICDGIDIEGCVCVDESDSCFAPWSTALVVCMMFRNGDDGGCEEDADSGDEDGEGSENIGEEWLVVGLEALDAVVAIEVTLPR